MDFSGYLKIPKIRYRGFFAFPSQGDITLEVICFSDPDFGPYVFKERRLEDMPDEDITLQV